MAGSISIVVGKKSSGGGGGSVNTGVLQISGGVPLDITLRAVTDQASTASPLYLSTRQVGIDSTRSSVSNNDSIFDVTGTFTSRNTANETLMWGYIRPSLIGTAGGQTLIGLNIAPTFTPNATSDTAFRPLSINYTINNSTVQSGTATGIYLNATETALNSMTHNLMDLGTGGGTYVSRFKVGRIKDVAVNFNSSADNFKLFTISRVGDTATPVINIGCGSGPTGTQARISSNGDDLALGTSSGSTFTERFIVMTSGLLGIAGTSNAFPAIKRSSTAIHFRLADDSDFTTISTSLTLSKGISALNGSSNGRIYFQTWNNMIMNVEDSGVGIASAAFLSATAKLHIGAGTATAGTAPLKFTAGTNMTTPENGAFEYDGTNLYFTTGGTRKTVTLV